MFDWAEFLRLARALAAGRAETPPTEAGLRSAVSRAYYAVFNEAVERAIEHGLDPGPKRDARGCKQSSHKACWAAYKGDTSLRQVGIDGERLHLKRIDADYSPTRRNWVLEAEDAIESAAQLRLRL